MTETVKIISPIDGRVYAERPVASGAEIETAVAQGQGGAQGAGARSRCASAPSSSRISSMRCSRKNDEIVPELAWQMGRPVRFGGETRGVEERARHMIAIAEESLAPSMRPDKDGLQALDRARAAGHGDGHRAVELSVTSPPSIPSSPASWPAMP